MSDAKDNAKQKLNEVTQEAKEVLQEAVAATSENAKELAQDAQESVQQAAKATCRAADRVAGKAQDGIHAVEKELSPAIDELACRAHDLVSKGIDFCADSSERARRQLHCAADATNRYVVEQPCKSIALAAIAGAAIATAILLGRRR